MVSQFSVDDPPKIAGRYTQRHQGRHGQGRRVIFPPTAQSATEPSAKSARTVWQIAPAAVAIRSRL